MGNPEGVRVAGIQPSLTGRDNGILAAVPGEIIGRGSQALPPAETMQRQTATAMMDGGWLGQVSITYKSQQMRHRRTSYWAWVAVRADRVMTREAWIDAFTRRGLELDERLSGTDWDEIALELLEQHQPDELDPRAAAEAYLRER